MVDEKDNLIVSWAGKSDMPGSAEIAAILQQHPDGEIKYRGFQETWNVVKQINSRWNWRLVTFMSDKERYREPWSNFWFVISVSVAALLAVLLFYFVLTGKVRDRFTATIERIDKYSGAEIENSLRLMDQLKLACCRKA